MLFTDAEIRLKQWEVTAGSQYIYRWEEAGGSRCPQVGEVNQGIVKVHACDESLPVCAQSAHRVLTWVTQAVSDTVLTLTRGVSDTAHTPSKMDSDTVHTVYNIDS